MKRNRSIFLRLTLFGLFLSCPRWVLALGLPFASPPLVIEAKGMGNAVVADGSLFNASAYNPALLQNQADFFEFHLGLNLGNDIIGIVNYLTNSDNINNLQNSMQNIGPSFQDISNGLSAAATSGSVDYKTYNQGVAGIQNAANNIQTALNNLTGKTVQLGAGLQFAFRIDEHFGFQAYNTTQAAVQVSRGNLASAILALGNLPTLPNSSNAAVSQAAVSLYYDAQTLVNAALTSAQQQQLTQAVSIFQNTPVSNASVSTFGNSVSQIMSGIIPDVAQQALFTGIIPITVLTYSDTVLMGTYCMRPLEADNSLTVGANLKMINRRIASVSSAFLAGQSTSQFSDIGNDLKNDIQQSTWRWGLDLGVLYTFDEPRISVGAAATDLLHSTATLNTQPNDPLYGLVTDPAPTVVRVGASYKPIKELTLNADFDDLFSGTSYFQGLDFFTHFDFGFNYNLLGILQFRGGVTNGNLCGGMGLPLGIQYAFAVDNLTQSFNHYLQFDIAF